MVDATTALSNEEKAGLPGLIRAAPAELLARWTALFWFVFSSYSNQHRSANLHGRARHLLVLA